MVAFSCKVNYANNLTKSTFKTGLIAEIAPVITREVIMENEIVDLNILFLKLSNIFQVLFTIFGYECILRLQCLVHCSWSVQQRWRENILFASNAMDVLQKFD